MVKFKIWSLFSFGTCKSSAKKRICQNKAKQKLILDKICLRELVSVSYFPHFEVLISLFRRWLYMECFLGLMEYLECQRAVPREDYDVWEGQGSITGQFAAVARVI